MNYAATLLPAGCLAGLYVLGHVAAEKRLQLLALVGTAGDAVVALLSRWQDTGSLAYYAAACFIVILALAPWLRRLRELDEGPKPCRRERRAMRELFGEPTAWDMLFRDPRIKTWRQKHP